MGKPAARKVLRQRGRLSRRIAIRPGVEYREYEYFRDGLTAYALGFLGPPARQRLVHIRTWWWRDHTREGIRIGTRERVVRARYRERLSCGVLPGTHGGTVSCRLRGSGGNLVFLIHHLSCCTPGEPAVRARVSSMVVRAPDLRISILLPGE